VLRSLNIVRASLAQIDTEIAEKYANIGRDIRKTIARLQSYITYTISEEGIRFLDPDYDSDRAQKLFSSSMSRHLSTRNISSKSMRAFLSNLAQQTDRQTDKQTDRQASSGVRAKTYTSSFVGSKQLAIFIRGWQSIIANVHCESEKVDPFSFEHNFGKYCPILIILSLLQTEINCDQAYPKMYHHIPNLLVHYFVKCTRMY